jgi:hypothetical protein
MFEQLSAIGRPGFGQAAKKSDPEPGRELTNKIQDVGGPLVEIAAHGP